MIEPWTAGIPGAELVLRNYDDVLETGGSPQDFFVHSRIPHPPGLLRVGRPNRSLPLAAMEIVRRANHELPREDAHKFCQHMLLKGHLIPADPDDEIEMFGAKMRRQLLAEVAPVNDHLSKLSGTDSFFPDFDRVGQTRPIPELEAAARYLAQMDPAEMPNAAVQRFIEDLQRAFRHVTA